MHIQQKLPKEYQICMAGMKQCSGWTGVLLMMEYHYNNNNNNENGQKDNNNGNRTMTESDNKTRLQALALINDCYKYIIDLTTSGVVITYAVKFVQTNKEKLTTASSTQKDIVKNPKNLGMDGLSNIYIDDFSLSLRYQRM
jgi:hypothetical protein